MTLTRSALLIVAAVVCFVMALLIALNALDGNSQAWTDGGLVAFAGSFLP